jgi:predicted DNA-binding protein YlxM (UPF0122 family)
MMRQTMTNLSLFTGSGIGDYAAAQCGIRTVAMCENDPWCCYALEWMFPEAKLFKDVRLIHSRAYLDTAVKEWYIPDNGQSYNQWEVKMAGKLKKLTKEQAEESVRMYEAGLSLGQIGAYWGVSRQAMWSLLKRRTTIRSQKRYGEENHFYRGGTKADKQAQDILEAAIKSGRVQRKVVCEQCGSSGFFKDGRNKVQAHHCDYNKPMDATWLCVKCHQKWHKHNRAKPKEVMQELPDAIDIVSGGFP